MFQDPAAFPEFRALARARVLHRGVGLLGRVWALSKPVWSTQLQRDSDFTRASAAEKDGLQGAVAFPVLVEGECLGVMEFLSREQRPADDDLLERFAAIGSQIGQYMERKRTEEELRRSEERFRALVENSTDASSRRMCSRSRQRSARAHPAPGAGPRLPLGDRGRRSSALSTPI